jgi:transposase
MSRIAISDSIWKLFEPFMGDYRPRKHTLRRIWDGILWMLRTGAQWEEMPKRYPPKSTVYWWYRRFVQDGVLTEIFMAVVQALESAGKLDLRECSVDATFIRARATRDGKGKTKCGKGHKLMAIVDGKGHPLGLLVDSANPHELKLLQQVIDALATEENPENLLGDKAYDDDGTDARLEEQGINLIAPHRKNRTKPKTQDGRSLRRYKRRWKIEQFFAHLHNYRKITLCYEKYLVNYIGFAQLASLLLLINKI